jgi:hypothetical protein
MHWRQLPGQQYVTAVQEFCLHTWSCSVAVFSGSQRPEVCALRMDAHKQRLASGGCSCRQRRLKNVPRRCQPLWRCRELAVHQLEGDPPAMEGSAYHECRLAGCRKIATAPEQADGREHTAHNAAAVVADCNHSIYPLCVSPRTEAIRRCPVVKAACLRGHGPLDASTAAALCKKRENPRSMIAWWRRSEVFPWAGSFQ